MRNRLLFLAAIALIGAALLFFGLALWQLTLPDVITTEAVQQVIQPPQATRHSHDIAFWSTIGAGLVLLLACTGAALIASEIHE